MSTSTTPTKRRLPMYVIPYELEGKKTRYRGRFKRHGKQYVTGIVDTPKQAAAAVQEKMASIADVGTSAHTLGSALKLERRDSVRRNVGQHTLDAHDNSAAFLLCYFKPETPLHLIDEDAIVEFFGRTRKEPYLIGRGVLRIRGTNTVREKDLALLSRAFKRAKMHSPVREAIAHIGKSLRVKRPPAKHFTSFAEAGAVIERVRSEEIQWNPHTRKIPSLANREWEADILSIFLVTAARAGEMARMRAKDFTTFIKDGVERMEIHLHSNKGEDKDLPIPLLVMPAAKRLIKAASSKGGVICPGGMREVSRITRSWAGVARLNEPRLTARALRHTFCSCAQTEGIMPTAIASASMGHANTQHTARYTHAVATNHASSFDELAERAFAGSAK